MARKSPIDQATIGHFLVGAAMGLFIADQKYAIGAVLFYQNAAPKLWPNYKEENRNMSGDILIGVLGVEMGRKLRGKV
jgi:hypothetical protein